MFKDSLLIYLIKMEKFLKTKTEFLLRLPYTAQKVYLSSLMLIQQVILILKHLLIPFREQNIEGIY